MLFFGLRAAREGMVSQLSDAAALTAAGAAAAAASAMFCFVRPPAPGTSCASGLQPTCMVCCSRTGKGKRKANPHFTITLPFPLPKVLPSELFHKCNYCQTGFMSSKSNSMKYWRRSCNCYKVSRETSSAPHALSDVTLRPSFVGALPYSSLRQAGEQGRMDSQDGGDVSRHAHRA